MDTDANRYIAETAAMPHRPPPAPRRRLPALKMTTLAVAVMVLACVAVKAGWGL